MALRNQPYIKFFPKDWLSDDKLNECCANSHGVFISLMCLMHQSQEYGVILLKQKYKQSTKQTLNFAYQFENKMPFPVEDIERGLEELINEDVIQLNGSRLSQKRMVKDVKLSDVRSEAGKVGGKSSVKNKNFASDFAQAKSQANYEYEYVLEYEHEYDNEPVIENDKKGSNVVQVIIDYLNAVVGTKYKASSKATQAKIKARLKEGFTVDDFKTVINKKYAEWRGTEWSQYLRPETLFGTKFESYLNQMPKGKKSSNPFLDDLREDDEE